jgi:hypothetical protein
MAAANGDGTTVSLHRSADAGGPSPLQSARPVAAVAELLSLGHYAHHEFDISNSRQFDVAAATGA